MAEFEDLPLELHTMIFNYLLVCDKPVITSKQMHKGKHERDEDPPSRLTSRLTLAFASTTLRERYRKFLEDYVVRYASVIRVNVVDYSFHNFVQFLAEVIKPTSTTQGVKGGLGYPIDCLKRFHFTVGGTNPIDVQDLDGPYFAANIIFTRDFENEGTKLHRWLTKAGAIGKKSGHLRVFYKVTDVTESPAMNAMLGGLICGSKEDTGQLKFLNEALRKKFSPPESDEVDPAILAALRGNDINRGMVKDLYESVDGEVQNGGATMAGVGLGAAAPPFLGGLPALGGLPMFNPPLQQPAAAPFGGLPYMLPALVSSGQPLPALPALQQPPPTYAPPPLFQPVLPTTEVSQDSTGGDGVRIKEEADDEGSEHE